MSCRHVQQYDTNNLWHQSNVDTINIQSRRLRQLICTSLATFKSEKLPSQGGEKIGNQMRGFTRTATI